MLTITNTATAKTFEVILVKFNAIKKYALEDIITQMD
jgi:hypothetical protein